jgi:hypothetical protein
MAEADEYSQPQLEYEEENEPADPFCHQPLPSPRSFRLLKFPEVQEEYEEPTYEIEIHCLDQAPLYSALSYTWDSPIRVLSKSEFDGWDPEESIDHPTLYGGDVLCNSQHVKLRENLYDALMTLSESRAGEYLWVDALCIDQENLSERCAQVLLMAEIYSSAHSTILYLGNYAPDLPGVKMVLDEFRPAYTKWYDSLDARMKAFSNRTQITSPAFLQELNLKGSAMDWVGHWRSLRKFFWRTRWFQRVWIIQEVSLASSIEVVCEEDTLEWEAIIDIIRIIQNSGLALPEIESSVSNPHSSLRTPLKSVDKLVSIWTMCVNNASNKESFRQELQDLFGTASSSADWYAFFLLLLHETRSQACSDLRDKVYATWSLAKNFAPKGLESAILPDYTVSVEKTYLSVTKALCLNLPKLAVLSYVLRSDGNESIAVPSWVPDFTIQPHGMITLNCYPHFNSAPPGLDAGSVSVFGSSLNVAAYHIDTIVDSCPSMGDLSEACNLQPCLEMFLNLKQEYTQTGEDRLDVLWRTIICDTSGNDHPAPMLPSRQRFKSWVTWLTMEHMVKLQKRTNHDDQQKLWLQEICRVFARFQSPDLRLPTEDVVMDLFTFHTATNDTPISELDDEYVNYHHCHNYYKDFHRICTWALNERALFCTSKGHVGLTLGTARVGDQIWLLGDAKVPFTLRKTDNSNQFYLVGDTYLHGFMHGDKLDHNIKDQFISISIV